MKYKLTYIVKNFINDEKEVDTVQEAYQAIKEACDIYDLVGECLDDFYDKFADTFAADLLGLEIGGVMAIPFINDDSDYGALLISVERE